jgi:formamidopyrimidine-DNA glycosylase
VPELPEVETVVRELRPLLVGRRLTSVRQLTGLALRKPWQAAWQARLAGQTVRALSRRGKWIVLELDAERALVMHLGMTGQLTVVHVEAPLRPHTHLVFDLGGGEQQLRFRDVRRFGSATLFETCAERAAFFAEVGLGPEPFDLDPAYWRGQLRGKRPIKAVLLDQQVAAGVGNIYADESLFEARLHPARRACDLGRAEAERLRKAVARVLTRAIEARGSTIRDYVGGSGRRGGYQDELGVYGRTGEPCRRCRTPIACMRLAGRSTHYCPHCQKEKAESRKQKLEIRSNSPCARRARF